MTFYLEEKALVRGTEEDISDAEGEVADFKACSLV